MKKHENVSASAFASVVVSSDAASIVKDWMQSSGVSVTEGPSQTYSLTDASSRPARLGLGANFVPHSAVVGGSKLEQKLKKTLSESRKRGLDDDDDRLMFENDDSGDESKYSALKARSTVLPHEIDVVLLKPKEKRKKSSITKGNTDSSIVISINNDNNDKNAKNEVNPSLGIDNAAPIVDDDHQDSKKKRIRTRSRQKNIRKDNRPVASRPTYLTPTAPDYVPPGPGRKTKINQLKGGATTSYTQTHANIKFIN